MEVKKSESKQRIVLVTKVPESFSSSDLVDTFSCFGKITDTLLVQSKHQAFIEFESPESAKKCIETYKGPMIPYISEKSHIVHKEETTANKVLHITFDNLKYPLIADLLYTGFMPYGEVHKVIIFKDTKMPYAHVAMNSIESAIKAKEALNGQSLFSDGNKMNINYSRIATISIPEQSDTCKDYTIPFNEDIEAEEGPSAQELLEEFKIRMIDIDSSKSDKVITSNVIEPSAVLFVQNVSKEVVPINLFVLFGCFGNVDAVRLLESKPGSAMIQMSTKEEANIAKTQLDGCPLYGQELLVSTSKAKEIYKAKGTINFKDSKLNRYYKPGSKNQGNIAVTLMLINIAC